MARMVDFVPVDVEAAAVEEDAAAESEVLLCLP